MSERATLIATTYDILLLIVGLGLLWRLVVSPAARAERKPSPLLPWEAPVSEFLTFLMFVICGSMGAVVAVGALLRRLPLAGDAVTVINGAGAQLGMLAGIAAYHFGVDRTRRGAATQPGGNIFVAGAATFLISLPILTATSVLWETALKTCGLPAEKQDLIHMFTEIDSPWQLSVMIALAVAIAPVTEELTFRAGLFRYFRTRMPRGVALAAPAVIFASLHVNWNTLDGLASLLPLIALAIIFSLAYERTGRIGTSMVAHALFNLNTVILIFAGVSP